MLDSDSRTVPGQLGSGAFFYLLLLLLNAESKITQEVGKVPMEN